jgi:hypothetical protein
MADLTRVPQDKNLPLAQYYASVTKLLTRSWPRHDMGEASLSTGVSAVGEASVPSLVNREGRCTTFPREQVNRAGARYGFPVIER